MTWMNLLNTFLLNKTVEHIGFHGIMTPHGSESGSSLLYSEIRLHLGIDENDHYKSI
jgi:hypothetical protein